MNLTSQDGKLRNETPLEAAARRCRELKRRFDAACGNEDEHRRAWAKAESYAAEIGALLAEAREDLDRLVYGESL